MPIQDTLPILKEIKAILEELLQVTKEVKSKP